MDGYQYSVDGERGDNKVLYTYWRYGTAWDIYIRPKAGNIILGPVAVLKVYLKTNRKRK